MEAGPAAPHLGLTQYFDCSWLAFVPFAYLDCVDVHEDRFKERGADSINLIVGNHRANMVRGELGLRLLDDFCCAAFVPFLPFQGAWFANGVMPASVLPLAWKGRWAPSKSMG